MYGPDTTQRQMFDGTVKHLVRDVLEGGNSIVFTYGVTNAGKTFTFLGQNLLKNYYYYNYIFFCMFPMCTLTSVSYLMLTTIKQLCDRYSFMLNTFGIVPF